MQVLLLKVTDIFFIRTPDFVRTIAPDHAISIDHSTLGNSKVEHTARRNTGIPMLESQLRRFDQSTIRAEFEELTACPGCPFVMVDLFELATACKAHTTASFAQCSDRVDVSCCSVESKSFCGNPLHREKVDVRMNDFMAAWTALCDGKKHWLFECDLNLYLSQCCLLNMEDASLCDISPDRIHLPAVPNFLTESATMQQMNMWINTYAARSTLHYDAYHNLLLVAEGQKQVVLLSPSCTRYLDPVPATDENPNHSRLSYDAVLAVVQRINALERPANREDLHAYCVTIRAGEALYIPEGWWHQVESTQCTMAVNYWFTPKRKQEPTPAPAQASKDISMLKSAFCPYQMRKAIHELLTTALKEERSTGLTPQAGQGWYPGGLTQAGFEQRLNSLLLPAHSIDQVSSESVDGTTRKRKAETGEGDQDHRQVPRLGMNTESDWLGFVNCTAQEQEKFWIPYAEQYPDKWVEVLTSLPSVACARLLDYWDDTLGCSTPSQEGQTSAPNDAGTPEQTQKCPASMECLFDRLFAPCGDRASEVRHHLITQKNKHREAVGRRVLGEVLGLPL